jgi:hypothetical protein
VLFWARYAATRALRVDLPAYTEFIDAFAEDLRGTNLFDRDTARTAWAHVWGTQADTPAKLRRRLMGFYCELFFLGELNTTRFAQLLDALYFAEDTGSGNAMLASIDARYLEALRNSADPDSDLIAAIADAMFSGTSALKDKLRKQLETNGLSPSKAADRSQAALDNFIAMTRQIAKADNALLQAAIARIYSYKDDGVAILEILGTVAAAMHERQLLVLYAGRFLEKVASYTALNNATAWLSVATECHRSEQAGAEELVRILGNPPAAPPQEQIRAAIIGARLPDKITQALFENVDWSTATNDEVKAMKEELKTSVFFTPEIVAPGNFLVAFNRLIKSLDA